MLLKLHEYLTEICYKLVIFQNIVCPLNEATMKQQMISISDYILVYWYQNYKIMWNKRTGSKGKHLSKAVLQRPVTAKYSLTFHDNVFRCQKKTHKSSKHLSFRHTCNVEEV